ncbi:hypothetical protein C8R47DRAFT_1194091 [Mycena vitilis]|nr:hypothetical protein C8R47DRAFT_1194091 [Mycena vitilis]
MPNASTCCKIAGLNPSVHVRPTHAARMVLWSCRQDTKVRDRQRRHQRWQRLRSDELGRTRLVKTQKTSKAQRLFEVTTKPENKRNHKVVWAVGRIWRSEQRVIILEACAPLACVRGSGLDELAAVSTTNTEHSRSKTIRLVAIGWVAVRVVVVDDNLLKLQAFDEYRSIRQPSLADEERLSMGHPGVIAEAAGMRTWWNYSLAGRLPLDPHPVSLWVTPGDTCKPTTNRFAVQCWHSRPCRGIVHATRSAGLQG